MKKDSMNGFDKITVRLGAIESETDNTGKIILYLPVKCFSTHLFAAFRVLEDALRVDDFMSEKQAIKFVGSMCDKLHHKSVIAALADAVKRNK